jgi:hypothetical protein
MTTVGINRGLLHGTRPESKGFGQLGACRSDFNLEQFAAGIDHVLGSGVQISTRKSLTDSTAQSSSRSLTGIPYAVDGESVVFTQQMQAWLSETDDPIGVILGTAFHKSRRIMVVRTEYIGGDATVIPERGHGKTMSKRVTARYVTTVRIGNNFSMNLNYFLRPAEAKQEFTDFSNLQRLTIQRAIKRMGWEAVFREGTRIMDELARTSTALGQADNGFAQYVRLDRMFATTIAFSIVKHRFGMRNLMAIVARLQVYSPSTAKRKIYDILVASLGFLDYESTQPEVMYNYLSGTTASKIPIAKKLGLTGTKIGNLTVMEYVPIANYTDSGMERPTVESSPTEELISIALHFIQTRPNSGTMAAVDQKPNPGNALCRVLDFVSENYVTLPEIERPTGRALGDISAVYGTTIDSSKLYLWWRRPQLTINTENMVAVHDPGPNTGEIVMQYPKAGISTSQISESLEATFRVYANAYLKYKENVLIINNVRPMGYVAGGGCNTNDHDGQYNENEDDLISFITKTDPNNQVLLAEDEYYREQCKFYRVPYNHMQLDKKYVAAPVISYQGTMVYEDDTIRALDLGHLGPINLRENCKFIPLWFFDMLAAY